MKKIFAGIVLLSLIGLLVMPSIVNAVVATPGETIPNQCIMSHTITNCPAKTVACPFDSISYNCGICCMLNAIQNITDWIFYIFMLAVVIMVVIGGFSYLTAAGDPEKAKKGQQILVYAIIGLAIALLAKLIHELVRFFIGV